LRTKKRQNASADAGLLVSTVVQGSAENARLHLVVEDLGLAGAAGGDEVGVDDVQDVLQGDGRRKEIRDRRIRD